jgi:hypothetical protein
LHDRVVAEQAFAYRGEEDEDAETGACFKKEVRVRLFSFSTSIAQDGASGDVPVLLDENDTNAQNNNNFYSVEFFYFLNSYGLRVRVMLHDIRYDERTN